MLSTQNIFLDRSSVEGHRTILRDILNSDVKKEGTKYEKHDCDALYFGGPNMSLISRMKLPLHMVIDDPSKMEFKMDMLVERVKDRNVGDGYGKNSVKTSGNKELTLFTNNEHIWVLCDRARVN